MTSSRNTYVMEDEHRMFLQGIMCRKLLNVAEIRELLRICCQSNDSDSNNVDILGFINIINKNIEPFHMAIKKCTGEQDGKHFYALISVQDSPLSRLASDFTSSEQEYFKLLLDTVVQSEQGFVSSTSALNLAGSLSKPLSKVVIQDLLGRLEEEKWIIQVTGRIMLSPLTILEFDQYIKDTYEDIAAICPLCKCVALLGEKCENCNSKIHLHCAKRYFQNVRKCPNCNASWHSDIAHHTSARTSKRPSHD